MLVRYVIGALAAALSLPPQQVDDVKLAVTEACTNVIRHAYREAVGPLSVNAGTEDGMLVVTVEDEGVGLKPRPDDPSAGLGLPLMAAVAQRVEIEQGRRRGTRIRMSFTAER